MRVDHTLPPITPPQSEAANESGRPVRRPIANSLMQSGPADEAHLSTAVDRVTLQAQIAKIPDIRLDKVNALVQAMRQGTWNVSPEDLADSLLSSLRSDVIR
jgi:flagellar biosynthesis anti-sigma factor FlgM